MSEEKNRKSESKEEPPKNKRHFNQEQYDRLVLCSEKKDITEWNEWRKANPDEDILLEGADFVGCCLKDVSFDVGEFKDIQTGELKGCHIDVCLRDAYFYEADLKGARFYDAHIEGAKFYLADLRHSIFQGAIVDGSTLVWRCKIDRKTNFYGVGLGNTRIDSGTKTLLKYNIRRMNWRGWYNEHWALQWPVKLFWLMSDYGKSTGRIMLTFFALAIAFAFVYSLWPCCVMVNNVVGDIRGFVHALYFSVVTMTTLGFGDIAANPDSWPGQVVLMIQVILGYVLLGALVTRLAVLFTSDGPAGSFTPMDKETKELLTNLKENKEKAK